MEVAGSINWTGLGHQVDFSWDKINPRALEDTDCGGGGQYYSSINMPGYIPRSEVTAWFIEEILYLDG